MVGGRRVPPRAQLALDLRAAHPGTNPMPYTSSAQARWAHTKSGMDQLGPEKVHEFDQATDFSKLPLHKESPKRLLANRLAAKRNRDRMRVQGGIRHGTGY